MIAPTDKTPWSKTNSEWSLELEVIHKHVTDQLALGVCGRDQTESVRVCGADANTVPEEGLCIVFPFFIVAALIPLPPLGTN